MPMPSPENLPAAALLLEDARRLLPSSPADARTLTRQAGEQTAREGGGTTGAQFVIILARRRGPQSFEKSETVSRRILEMRKMGKKQMIEVGNLSS